MMYRLWKIEYDEKHAKMITQDYIYCQSKNQLMGAISRTLDQEEIIEDIALLIPTNPI